MAETVRSPTRVCVLISGNGSNLQALIDHSSSLGICIVLVISNISKAFGLERAKKAGIPTLLHSFAPYKSRPDAKAAFDSELADLVLGSKAQLLCCLGYMRILQPVFLEKMKSARVIGLNLHPALPREYDGLHAIERAHQDWRDGKIRRTGVMIHHIIEEMDAGEPVTTREIAFVPGEDEDIRKFEDKLHLVEHEVVIEGVRKIVTEISPAHLAMQQPPPKIGAVGAP